MNKKKNPLKLNTQIHWPNHFYSFSLTLFPFANGWKWQQNYLSEWLLYMRYAYVLKRRIWKAEIRRLSDDAFVMDDASWADYLCHLTRYETFMCNFDFQLMILLNHCDLIASYEMGVYNNVMRLCNPEIQVKLSVREWLCLGLFVMKWIPRITCVVSSSIQIGISVEQSLLLSILWLHSNLFFLLIELYVRKSKEKYICTPLLAHYNIGHRNKWHK